MQYIKKIGMIGFLISILIAISGAIYQHLAQKADENLAPGNFFNVKNKKFHMYCQGSGNPTVILMSGHLQDYGIWLKTMNEVKGTTRVCSYDRLGIGWSSAASEPVRATNVAENLYALLKKSNTELPVILAGFSAGGIYSRKYYELYPETVSGLIFVDSSHEQQGLAKPLTEIEWQKFNYFSGWGLCSLSAWTGILRFTGYHEKWMSKLKADPRYKEKLAMAHRTGYCPGRLLSNSFQHDVNSPTPPKQLGNLPTITIQRGKNYLKGYSPELVDYVLNKRPLLQKELASLSTDSISMVAEGCEHGIPFQQPEIIVDAIDMMVSKERENPYRSKKIAQTLIN